MATRLKLDEVLGRVQNISYPPSTLTLHPSKALGYRLAKPVTARGNQPSRPVALTDGLAVTLRDLVSGSGDDEEDADTAASYDEQPGDGGDLPEPGGDSVDGEGSDSGDDGEDTSTEETASLKLRPFPRTNRKEDALHPGQAIPVRIGSEVPRGGDLVYPLHLLTPEPEEFDLSPLEVPGGLEPEPQPDRRHYKRRNNRNNRGNDDNGDDEGEEELPPEEPPRDWDLLQNYERGRVGLPRGDYVRGMNVVPIGGWARNRDVLLAEKTQLRAGELALLEALGVDEVDVFRRPVVGVASLALPFPRAQRSTREQEQPHCPLAAACINIMRQASVAALELGYAPGGFRALKKAVERWVQQVDILLLVGGSHHGPKCLGLDVLRTIGEVRASGYDAEPGGALSAGVLDGWPVLVCPGGLPDAVAATVLAVRPLAHKYLTPVNFSGSVQLRLDNGSQIRGERTRVAPVRFGWDDEAGCYATRFTGEVREPWMDFIRAQALVVLEGGHEYSDGEVVTAHTY